MGRLFRSRWGLRLLLVLFALQAISACSDDYAGIQAIPEVKITVTPTDTVLTTGAKAKLEATIHDAEGRVLTGRDIKWSSSAPDIVSVSPMGVVTALAVGRASIGAYSGQSVGFARVVVQLTFRLPVSGTTSWIVITEMGTPTLECVGNEGGLRLDGRRDCTHAGISRYSLDFADGGQWSGALPATPAPEVFATADGTITDICIQAPIEITCGANGPFVLVEHAGGFSTIYAHLDPGSVTLRRKTPVRRGQPLGTMGAWGTDPAPWLHFELRFENKGAAAARVLESVPLSGHPMRDYRVANARDTLRS